MKEDRHWYGEVQSDATLTAEYIFYFDQWDMISIPIRIHELRVPGCCRNRNLMIRGESHQIFLAMFRFPWKPPLR